ncbi:hypothetical protein MATL_G00143420 [Megalops atlanticus]|uniref:Uncharacterized protein n=1 Tax=Megalops atlanticus TaxID=7932 RepID=A0A9D3PUN7_MEGAT|nr:hypothetical protein MATL_G00143420 [Megalops atlanticus]
MDSNYYEGGPRFSHPQETLLLLYTTLAINEGKLDRIRRVCFKHFVLHRLLLPRKQDCRADQRTSDWGQELDVDPNIWIHKYTYLS